MNRSKSLYIKGRMIYRKTPVCFRWIFLPVKLILGFIRIILRLIRILRLGLWIITGEEITSGQKLAIIYAGGEQNKNFLLHIAFGDSYRENYIGKTWIWKFFKMVKTGNHNCSLMVAEVPKVFRVLFDKKKCFYIPCWISGEIDISVDISLVIDNSSIKSSLRRVRKNKLNFELTNEVCQLYNFYHSMYLPYITKTHGNKAVIVEYDFMKKEFRNCDLLLVKKGGEYIAGGVIAYSKSGVRLWALGVKDGNIDYVKDGGTVALYYFSILSLKEKGFKRLNFGFSRAFLKDSVLQYKKKWRLQIVDTEISRIGFLTKPLSKTTGVKGFFLNNPFIYMDKGRFNGAVFVEKEQPFLKEDFKKIVEGYYLQGMSNLIVYQFEKSGSKMKESVPHEFDDRVRMRSAESLF